MRNASLLCILLLAAAPAGAIFGIGEKKGEEEPAKASPPPSELPGYETPPPAEGAPRMAEEEAVQAPASAEQKVSESETVVGEHPAAGALPQEVVIRAEGGAKLKNLKPPLQIATDPFESIRESIKPDQGLLLAESPLTVVWRRTHPEFLRNPRVVEPWRTQFSDRPGMVFRPRDKLIEVLGRRIEAKEAKSYQWSLTIADEEGKVFQHFEGSSNPPEEILWDGQNDQDEWIKAGKAYSPVYMFTDPSGTPYTRAGKPIKRSSFVHQERTGLHVTIDSSALFGPTKEASQFVGEGEGMLRAAADLIKRRYPGVPLRIEAYSSTKELADRQAQAVQDYLMKELMLRPDDLSTDAYKAAFADQRLELVLLNR